METLYQDSSIAATLSFIGERVCNTCGDTKQITEFVKASRIVTGPGKGGVHSYKDGRKNICKPCQRIKNAEYAKRNPGYWSERAKVVKERREAGEKLGDTWKSLGAALGMFQRTTHSQRAA